MKGPITSPARHFRSGALLRNQLRQLLYAITSSQEGLTSTAGMIPGAESKVDADVTRGLLCACMGRLKALLAVTTLLRKQTGKGP